MRRGWNNLALLTELYELIMAGQLLREFAQLDHPYFAGFLMRETDRGIE